MGEGEEVGVVGLEERKEKKERRGFGVGGWGAGCAYVWVRSESVEGSFGIIPPCEGLGLLPTQPGTYTTPSFAPTMRIRSSIRARGCATSNKSRNASSRSMWREVSSRKTSCRTLRRIKRSRTAVSRWRVIKGDVEGTAGDGGVSYAGGDDDDDVELGEGNPMGKGSVV